MDKAEETDITKAEATSVASTPIQRVEGAVKLAVWSFGVMYGLGLLVSNVYLLHYGVSDSSIFRAQYVLKGMVFLLYLSMPVLVPLAAYLSAYYSYRIIVRHSKVVLEPAKRAVLFVIFLCLSLLVCFFLADGTIFTLAADKIHLGLWGLWKPYNSPYFLGYYLLLLVAIFSLWLAFAVRKSSATLATALGTFGALLFLASLTTTVFIYAENIYPTVEASLGGGFSERVDIIISKDGGDVIKSFGIDADDDVLKNACVIHESDSSYYILGTIPSTGEVASFRLPKNLVLGMKIRSRYLSCSP